MKRVFLLLFTFCVSVGVTGQELRIGAYGGMTLGRTVDNYHYTADFYEGFIQGAPRAGLSVSCQFENSFDLGLLYYHQNTQVPTTFYSGGNTFDRQFGLTIQWFLVDFVAYLVKGSVRPFFGTDFGMGILTLDDQGSHSSRAKFAWGGNLGLEFAFHKAISLRLKGDVLYSIKFNSPNPGINTNTNITAYNSYLHSGLSLGVIFRFKMHRKKKQ